MTLFGDQSFNPFIWVIPSMLDIFGTSLMYVGLTWTYAASYQILRASGMIITAVLSVSFFGTKVTVSHVIGMIFVGIGLVVVCVGDYVFFNGGGSGFEKNTVLAGDLIIIIAQLVMSLQMILQEKIIKKYKILPIQALGWESVFGIISMVAILFPMYFIPWHLPQSSSSWQERKSFEDTIDAFSQWGYSPQVLVSSLGLVFSIAVFNLLGLTVTEMWDSTTRMALIIASTIMIWIISISVGWQKFEPLQPVGYIIVSVGVIIYYYYGNIVQWIGIKVASMCADGSNSPRTPIMALQSDAA